MTRLASLLFVLVTACGGKPHTATGPTEGSATTPPPPPPAAAGQSCGTRGASPCPTDQFCSYGPGDECGATDKPGHCMAKPAACPRIVAPVCGCDGKTYNNGCEAATSLTGVKDNGACK